MKLCGSLASVIVPNAKGLWCEWTHKVWLHISIYLRISTSPAQYKLNKEYGENVHRIYKSQFCGACISNSTFNVAAENNSYSFGGYYHKPELSAFKKSIANMSTMEERAAFIQKEQDFTTLVHKVRAQNIFICSSVDYWLVQLAKLQKEWSASRPSRSDEIHETRERMIAS
jgi:hypothetical protein